MLAADFFHVNCALTLQRLYCLFVMEVGSRMPEGDPWSPPALQSPAAAHDTDMIWAPRPLSKAARPGTTCAFPQMPLFWVTTNAGPWPALSVYHPPALQLPAEPHHTESAEACPPLSKAAMPGTSRAVPHLPPEAPALATAATPVLPAAALAPAGKAGHNTAATITATSVTSRRTQILPTPNIKTPAHQ